MISFFSASVFALSAPEGVKPKSNWNFHAFESIPAQSGGRVKPLGSYAQEIVLYLIEKKTMSGWRASDLVLSWMTTRDAWDVTPLFRIRTNEVKRQLLLDESRTDFTPKELLSSAVVNQYLQEHASNNSSTTSGSTLKFDHKEEELKKVLDRLFLYLNLLTGRAFPVIPKAPPQPWEGLDVLRTAATEDPLRDVFVKVLKSYMNNEQGEFEAQSQKAVEVVTSQISNWESGVKTTLNAEIIYNRMRPFLWAWVLYLIAALVWIVPIMSKKEKQRKTFTNLGLALTYSGVLVHIFGFILRMIVSGRPPVSNMYESIVWVSFGCFVFATYLYVKTKQPVVMSTASALAAICLIAADAAPAAMDPGIHTLVPVLRSNAWLTIHVLTITLSYAAFALSLGIGNVALYHYIRGGAGSNKKIFDLNLLSYRAMQFGVVLIAAGTILGGVWADYSWGRFWGWDPKEVWALIVLLAYVAILHGRFAGWVGQFGFAALSVVCFLSVLMAWYGVNFVLGAGLHSYGFSSQSGLTWVAGFCLLQLIYVFVAYVSSRKKIKTA